MHNVKWEKRAPTNKGIVTAFHRVGEVYQIFD